MTLWQRITREPALILGAVTAGLSLAVLFGVDITAEQIAGVGVFLGAVLALLRFVLTPSSEVVAQEKPDGQVVAGAATWVVDGHPVSVEVEPLPTDLRPPDEHGAVSWLSVVVALLAAAALVLFVLILVR